MNELFRVIQWEYLSKVKSKSFIISTLLTPLLLSSIFLLPIYFAKQHDSYKELKIGLVDKTNSLENIFVESELLVKTLDDCTIDDINNMVLTNQFEGIICVTKGDSSIVNIQYYTAKQPSIYLQNQIKKCIYDKIVNEKLKKYGIDNLNEIVSSAKESVIFENIKLGSENKRTLNSSFQRTLCMALGVMIYMFIILFTSQVMRGVLEEKSNRIVELIITSISPIKFMAGKIIGIALLGLTQIVCWIIIMYAISSFISNYFSIISNNNFMNQHISQENIDQILNNLNLIDFNIVIPLFVYFFIGGYLLYSSLFAALAATANHNDDIQQARMIVTIPLILSVFVLANTVNSPDSSISYWFSIIPFTSPIVMVGRAVYGAPMQDIILSILFLLITVIFVIWLSGKVYQMTILNTGKKTSWNKVIFWIKNTDK